jgi:tartrate-resistant acid phosphatase type 5
VINGHDHCLGHFFLNNTNFILSGAAGYPQAGDCNNGTALGPYALYLGANNLTGEYQCEGPEKGDREADIRIAANGFVTLDISKQTINVEYYARDMKFEGTDLYPVECDLKPSYSFQITQNSI